MPAHHGGARQGGAGALEASDQDAADLLVVDDAGLRDMDRRDGRDVWLELAHLQRRQPADREAVGQTPVVQGAKPGQLSGGGGHDQLAGPRMGTPSSRARVQKGSSPRCAPAGLEAAGRVVEARVHHAAVAAGLVQGPVMLLLQHRDPGGWFVAHDALCDGQRPTMPPPTTTTRRPSAVISSGAPR